MTIHCLIISNKLITKKLLAMKKIFLVGLVLGLFTVAASAQKGREVIRKQRIERGFETHQLTRGEKFRLQRNETRYHHEKRRVMRDGRVTPMERRRLHNMRAHDRRQMFRYRHNPRRRVI
jgi:hypothetical protein